MLSALLEAGRLFSIRALGTVRDPIGTVLEEVLDLSETLGLVDETIAGSEQDLVTLVCCKI